MPGGFRQGRAAKPELAVGDKVLVSLERNFPADGVVVEGETSVNEAMLTGESKTRHEKGGRQRSSVVH